jgi:hypothetical protein
MTNRVAVDKPLTVRSVNGPTNTIIQGYQVPGTTNGDGAVRCVYLADGASLSGFTLTNGATQTNGDYSGGGVCCQSASAVVSNCVVVGNSADWEGGGVCGGTLDNCTLATNSASCFGGGAAGGTLNNCTLTGNSADIGGGAQGGTLNNCVVVRNSAWGGGGGVAGGTLNNCTLTGNSVGNRGGGACESTLNNCTLTGNNAWFGGGAEACTLNNCTLTGNSASGYGGGADSGTLNNCRLTANSANAGGGGASYATLNCCVITGNSAEYDGGGAAGSTLNNCTVTGNSAANGGGVSFAGHYIPVPSTLNNCTLTGNSASESGGGASGSTLNNCIVYFNTAPGGANYSGATLNYCCTTPLPPDGVGNISTDPQLASASHLSVFSPCRGAGNAACATGVDIDGEAWANPPSIGCDEYHAGAVTGPLSVSLVADYTNVTVGFAVALTALIEGQTTASAWDLGDGVLVSNRSYATYAWTSPGDYAVVLRAYNESYPAGVSATQMVHVVAQSVHYVALGSANPVVPYTSWATAATNIQNAVDAVLPGALVLVTNGTYTTGGRAMVGTMTNRVAVDKPLTVRSVNGPQFTVIQGYQVPDTTNGDGAVRCVYLTSGAVLSGFTLTNGATRSEGDWRRETSGGGLWCESQAAVASNCVLVGNSAYGSGGGALSSTLDNCTLSSNSAAYGGGAGACLSTLSNCTLTGNSAYLSGGGALSSTLNNCTLSSNSAPYGGGASQSTLNNCTLTGNSAGYGGGAEDCMLNNCTLRGNSASHYGGGAYGGTLNDCIVYFNTATNGPNFYQDEYGGLLNHCCTTPMPTNGVGNITNAPLFVDYPGGNLRLQSNSPCINAGRNAYAPVPTDLDGLPRIVSGTVDIGAYEFQGPGSTISYAWLQQYGLPTDGSADATDPDADGRNTWQEWRCLTDPTNALSVLRLLSASPAGTNVTVTWQSVAGVNYFLERSTNLWASPPFTLLAPNLPGEPGAMSFTDSNAAFLSPLFYRVGVP